MIDLKKVKKGTNLYHRTHGVVKFVAFNYGYCYVDAEQLVFYLDENNKFKQKIDWVTVKVYSANLKKKING